MVDSKHHNTGHQIWSIPHSGQRSLKRYLKRKYPRIECFHFGQKELTFSGWIHVPMRHPAEVIRSWVTRARHNPIHRSVDKIIPDYQCMVDALHDRQWVRFYDINSIPVLSGALSEHYPGVDYDDCSDAWLGFLDWYWSCDAAQLLFKDYEWDMEISCSPLARQS